MAVLIFADREGEMAKYARQWRRPVSFPRGHIILG
jgi:hypothetical protein